MRKICFLVKKSQQHFKCKKKLGGQAFRHKRACLGNHKGLCGNGIKYRLGVAGDHKDRHLTDRKGLLFNTLLRSIICEKYYA